MSTDDSVSEDVSSSGALSHCHVSPDGDGGKESETSLVSSEGTSASGLAGPEDRHIPASQTPGDTPDSCGPVDITPTCNKIRSLCLSSDEAFEQGKNLPFINPSPLETLRVLVQEIQSSGETDPEIWKDCEGRWLHLFQLVEKQYQEQILAQQEQYQCQIQLIQDEIKALVQLQNRQGSGHPTPGSATLILTDPSRPEDLTGAPAHSPLTSPSPPPKGQGSGLATPETLDVAFSPAEEPRRAATVASSGYGTLSVWEAGLGQTLSPRDVVHETAHRKGKQHKWTCGLQEDPPQAATGIAPQQSFPNEPSPLSNQHRASCANQPLTSWAQRQKLRLKKGKASSSPQVWDQEESLSPREAHRHTVPQDQHQLTGLSSNSFPLRRSDSLLSEVSGLTYWRLNENEIYHPLPDSFDSGAYLLLQEVSMSLTPPQEPRLSLRQIYENKQKTDPKHTDWDGSRTSSPLSPQVLTLDPAAHVRQSERTSGVTSPSNVSSPSPAPPGHHHMFQKHGTPVSPDSVVECSANNPGDTDCSSNMSSFSAVAPSPTKVQSSWVPPATAPWDKEQTACSFTARASEEEGSHTASTLKPRSTSAASQHVGERASLSGDPVALSLLRQNLREKHYRHVDDLRAYYESEIQALREKLNLRDLPQDLEKSNQALRERCEHLERALAEAASHIQGLESKNITLERKLVEWPERYAVATVKSLQERLEESRRCGGERDATAARLRSRVRQLEEEAGAAAREARDKVARREQEYKMLQDLLGEYDSLKKDHGGVKNNLASAEDKLSRANDQISELKRVISKLESQVKQLEHENQARSRHGPHSSTQSSGAGLFHHPDLLPSPSKRKAEPDSTSLRSPRRLTDQSESGRRSPFAQTNQSNGYRWSAYLQRDQSAGSGGGGSVDSSGGGSSRRCSPPPDKLQSHAQPPEHSGGGGGRRDRSSNQTPMLRALIELEETRSTQSRAPWVGSQRTTVGLVERKHKEPIQEQEQGVGGGGGGGDSDVAAELGRGSSVGPEQGASRAARHHHHDGGPERASTALLRPQRSLSPERAAAALLRPQRSLSPEGHRSSSLPPHHSLPPATPTKRETLLRPLSAKSSPKRCPTENYSTALGQLPRQQHLHKRLEVPLDQRRHSFHSPRKRLHFTTLSRDEDVLQSCSTSADFSGSVNPTEANSQLGWDEQRAVPGAGSGLEQLDTWSSFPARLHSLAEAERLLDELTQEKLQIEAALSRIPGAGSRVSLQSRLDEVALENRLERVNRELGSIRMTLKRFHVLRSSAHT